MTGAEMRQLRLKWQWTQAQLGEWLGYSLQTISRFERDLDAVPLAVARLMRHEDLLRTLAQHICPTHYQDRHYDWHTPI